MTKGLTQRCVLCGRARPKGDENWVVRKEKSLTGADLEAAVCPSCRIGNREDAEEHEPGTCSGEYAGPDAWKAICEEEYCHESWSCWLKECVEDWQENHSTDDCDCSHCTYGHHDSTLRKPEKVAT